MDSSNPLDDETGQGSLENAKPDTQQYSVAMVDTIFADTLSRGMQNAITSQQNAQMASSTSITNACARILQARATAPITTAIKTEDTDKQYPQSGPKLAITDLAKEAKMHEGFNLSSKKQTLPSVTSSEIKENEVGMQAPPSPHSEAHKVTQKRSKTKLALYGCVGISSLGALASGLYFALV
jgi:hypothetical protein